MRSPFLASCVATAIALALLVPAAHAAPSTGSVSHTEPSPPSLPDDGIVESPPDVGDVPRTGTQFASSNADVDVAWANLARTIRTYTGKDCSGSPSSTGLVSVGYGPAGVVVGVEPCDDGEFSFSPDLWLGSGPDDGDAPHDGGALDAPTGDVELRQGPLTASAFAAALVAGVGPHMIAPPDAHRAANGWTGSAPALADQSPATSAPGASPGASVAALDATTVPSAPSASGDAPDAERVNRASASLSTPVHVDEHGTWRVNEAPDETAPAAQANARLSEGGRDTRVDVEGPRAQGTSQARALLSPRASTNSAEAAQATRATGARGIATTYLTTPPVDAAAQARASGADSLGIGRAPAASSVAEAGEGEVAVMGPRGVAAAIPSLHFVAGVLLASVGGALCAFYSRMSRHSLTEQETRGQILRHIGERPGATYADISHALNLHRTTARYHIRLLARQGLVVTRGTAGRLRCFLPGSDESQRVAEIATLQADPAKRIAEAVTATPGLSIHDAAALAGIHRVTVHYHVKRMAAAGVLRVERDGRALRLYSGAPEEAPGGPGDAHTATPA